MSRSVLLLVGLVAGLALGLMSHDSLAGDDSSCFASNDLEYPEDGATDVPLNPILVTRPFGWDTSHYMDQFEALWDEDGNVVATEVAFVFDRGTCDYAVYRPVHNLEPDTVYEMIYEDSGGTGNTFTTGSSEDLEPPQIVVDEEPAEDFENDYWFAYSANEELVMRTHTELSSMGERGYIQRPDQAAVLNGHLTITFYDRAGNATVVEPVLGGGDDSGCVAAGVGTDRTVGLLDLLLGSLL